MPSTHVKLPDGTAFPFWEDETKYTKAHHVAARHPKASDSNPGTERLPFATISRAAAVLKPGEKVIVHDGIYRECVCPARGGEGPDRMIAYEAAPGETVTIRGSEPWTPDAQPSSGWGLPSDAHRSRIRMADLPPTLFVGYNPFLARNVPAELWTFTRDWTEANVHSFLLRCGMVIVDGRPLKQVFRVADLAAQDGAFWVEDPGLRIHFRLPGDADPKTAAIEVSVREQAFAPRDRHLGYIRVKGFTFEHGADSIPVPQRALVSTSRGHHWIIEDTTIRHANACGLDLGAQDWKSDGQDRSGHHIVRRNRVSDCGICGIAGGTGVGHTLVEDNLVERVGHLAVERIWECAGLKFHVCDGVLIRRNVFRHIAHAAGLWLDYDNRNSRVSGNVFADIESHLGGVYMECSHQLNLVDGNFFWDIRRTGGESGRGGIGCNADSNDHLVVAHNFFGKIQDYAVSVNLNQAGRVVAGRVGLGRQNHILNNVFYHCPKRILLGRADDNRSDGNLFDASDDTASLCVRYPDPQALVNLSAWREYYGLDIHSAQARIEATLDPETLDFSWTVDGDAPACVPVEAMHAGRGRRPPGPLDPVQYHRNKARRSGAQKLP